MQACISSNSRYMNTVSYEKNYIRFIQFRNGLSGHLFKPLPCIFRKSESPFPVEFPRQQWTTIEYRPVSALATVSFPLTNMLYTRISLVFHHEHNMKYYYYLCLVSCFIILQIKNQISFRVTLRQYILTSGLTRFYGVCYSDSLRGLAE